MKYLHLQSHGQRLLAMILLLLLSACGGGGGSPDPTPDTGASLSRIEVTPSLPSLANGTTLSLTATGIYSDNSSRLINSEVSWSSSDTNIATISNSGNISTQAPGQTTVQASLGGVTGSTVITVTSAELIRIDISPGSPTLPLGTTLTLLALGQFGDGSDQDLSTQVIWSSDDTGILEVDPTGLLTPKSLGSTTITASMAGVSANQTVTISSATLTSIEINTPTTSLPVGNQQALTAFGLYDDNSLQDLTQQVSWQTSPPDLLAISNASGSKGLATALAVGSVTISATLGGISGSLGISTSAATLDSIDISPPSAQLAAGTQTDFQATGRYSDGSIQDLSDRVTWATTNATFATISNASGNEGQAQGLSTGTTMVSATLDGITGNATLTVSAAQLLSISVLPAELTLAAGTQQSLRAEGNFSDGSVQLLDGQVSWASDSSAASVSNGAVTSLQIGNARISASLNGVSGNARIIVTNATLSSLLISPSSTTLPVGTNAQLQVSALYSDGSQVDVTESAVWSSNDDSLLRVDNSAGQQGRLTALATGTVLVTATIGGINDSTSVIISATTLTALNIIAASTNLDSAEQLQLTAMGDFSDGSSQDLTADTVWSSDQPARAFVSNNAGEQGLVDAGIGVSGVAVITASYGGFSPSPSINLTISNTPQRPVSLVVLATPNVILNNDSDTSTLEIRVQAADPNATIADTSITLQISLAGTVIDTRNLMTSGGIASDTFTTTQTGLLQIQASIDGTSISNSGTLYAAVNTYEVLASAGFSDVLPNSTTILSGVRFGHFLYNLSNRDFPLLRFEILNGSTTLFSTTSHDSSLLNGNVLSGGLQTGIIYQLDADIIDQGIQTRYELTDPATGGTITSTIVFTTP